MARILRGEIRWTDLNPTRSNEQAGLRPVVIISQDIFNQRSGAVIAMAITSQPQRAGFPLTRQLSPDELPKRSWAPKSVKFERSPWNALAKGLPRHRSKNWPSWWVV